MWDQLDFGIESTDEALIEACNFYKRLVLDYPRQIWELPNDAPRYKSCGRLEG